jgi:hypothetical protein
MVTSESVLRCVAACALALSCAESAGATQIVRSQSTAQIQVTVDGTIDASEWPAPRGPDAAVEISISEAAGYLQIGLRTVPLFVASVCVARGDTVRVFHASSALGRATYVRHGEEWRLTEGFEWRVRRTDLGTDADRERLEHRARYGWIANTVAMGAPGETEFQIDTAFAARSMSRIAVGFMLAGSDPATIGWPEGLDDDGCMLRSVIAGPLPESVYFRPERWPLLERGIGS